MPAELGGGDFFIHAILATIVDDGGLTIICEHYWEEPKMVQLREWEKKSVSMYRQIILISADAMPVILLKEHQKSPL